eukprot:108613-Chlamydomonas_euryale.AAC.14
MESACHGAAASPCLLAVCLQAQMKAVAWNQLPGEKSPTCLPVDVDTVHSDLRYRRNMLDADLPL